MPTESLKGFESRMVRADLNRLSIPPPTRTILTGRRGEVICTWGLGVAHHEAMERVVEEARTKIEGLDLLYALRECAIKQIVELYVENGQDANAVPKAKHADAQEASRKRSLSGAPDDGIAADPKRRCSKLRLEHRGNAETLHTSFTGSGIGGALDDPPPKHHAGLDSLSIEQADSLLGASHSGTLVVTNVPPNCNDPETRLFSQPGF
ncbi:uncharacterized protein C8Q71DRAFT_275421 [Rhodofomes roseus]|uniref:Uncharacterized protein n=1 Tax=Rhodofomes roseus TaxID=34475 RepID=A0ABQ8K4X3_9APHY|nr:uncharacterized protein C8Q71DRAFT_275421 [Rhodofomes roseus]KAH9831976.1 hypothetical protein C8Q71DRAFT_275421 [Rhodofomes roseus]